MSRGGSKGILYGPKKPDALSPCPQTCVAEGIADDVKSSGIPQFVSAQDVVACAANEVTVSDADVV
jgi:hypothetical protein